MGLLAVIDTFMVYKIAERRYNRNIALVASLLFAVTPLTWLTRMILLESILLPFLLFQFFLRCIKKRCLRIMIRTKKKKKILLLLPL